MKSNKIIKVFVINGHWKNRGDESAIRAMLDRLYSDYPNAQITVMFRGLTETTDTLTCHYKNIKIIEEYPIHLRTLLQVLPAYLSKGSVCLFHQTKQYVRQLRWADIVVNAPSGPNIGDLYANSEYLYLARLFLATRMNKPVFFYAPSMGPFESRFKNVFRKEILKLSRVVVREDTSGQYLKKLGINATVTLDSALQSTIDLEQHRKMLNQDERLSRYIGDCNNVVGITITNLKWHRSYNKDDDIEKKIKNIFNAFVQYLINKNYKILLLPQLFNSKLNDYAYMNRFEEELGTDYAYTLPDCYDGYMQQYIISKLHIVVGMRYHSNIFAAKMATPFISISYEHKMQSFMEIIGLEKNCIPVNDLSFNKLIDVFEAIEGNYTNEKRQLKEISGRIRLKALETSALLSDEIEKITLASNSEICSLVNTN